MKYNLRGEHSIVQIVLVVPLPGNFFFFFLALVIYLSESQRSRENLENQNSVTGQEVGNPLPHQNRINCDIFLSLQ